MNDNDIVNGLECCMGCNCNECPYIDKGDADGITTCKDLLINDALKLVFRQQKEIERLKKELYAPLKHYYIRGIKDFAENIDKLLKRYAHLHKYADVARQSTDEYADGTPIEKVSVWDVLSFQKWEMVEYETMNELQDNIEIIAKERLLSELEKDFRLLVKEMTEGK